ncbi:MAG: GAF domain-containing protein, partial [Deltaproteobacteria bacterium]|nr:GAF domain-containing protein [Deltaproteobacteria bacterium]
MNDRTSNKNCVPGSREKATILRQKEDLAARGRIISRLLTTFDLQERLETILEEVTAFLRAEFGGIYLREEERAVLRSWIGLSPRLRSHLVSFPLAEMPGWMTGACLFRLNEDKPEEIPGLVWKEGIQAFVSIPLKIPEYKGQDENDWIGTIFLAGKRDDAFAGHEMETLRRMADHLSFAVDHSRAYQEARERLSRLEVLRDIDQAIIGRRSLQEILRVVLERVPTELGADAVAVSLMNGEQERPEIFAMRLPNGTVIEEEAFSLAESLLHWFMERRETVIIFELAKDPRLQMHRDRIHGFRLSSYLGVPLVVADKTIGVLHILTCEPKVFEREAVAFFETMAGQVAIAIENVRLFETSRRQGLELEKKVAELEESKRRLLDSRARLSEAERIACIGNWDWRIEENDMRLSEGLGVILGRDAEEFDGTFKAAMHLIHPEDREFVKQAVTDALHKKGSFDIEHRLVLSDGTQKTVRQRAQVFFDEPNHPRRMFGTIQDVTREKEMEIALIQQEKMASLGHLAAGIAHEIRNPLSGINVCLDTIGENLDDPDRRDDIEELISEAKNATEKIEAVVKHVMDLAAPDKPSMRPINISEAIQEAILLSSATLRKSGIGLETDFAAAIPPVFADLRLIEQV